MTQLTFQNIRNLGANSNQPLITNQNDFQIFDNVTWIKGKHTREGRRQPDAALARDPQRRHDRRRLQLQQQHDVELRRAAGRLHGQQRDRLRRRQLHARPRQLQEPQPVRRRHLHREAAGVLALRAGRLPRHQPADAQPRPALGRLSAVDRDRRPPVELRRDDRQVRRRLGRRGDRRRRRSAATCRPTRSATSVRASASPTTSTATARRWSAAASACSGTSRPAARRRRRRRTRRSCSRRRSRRRRPPTASTCCSRTACRRLPASIPNRPAAGHDALDLRHQLPRRLRAAVEPQRPALARHELHGGSRLRRLAGPADAAQGRSQPGAAGRRRHRRERQPSLRGDLAGAADDRPGRRARARSTTTRCW